MNKIKLLAITLILSVSFFSCSDSIVNQPVQDNDNSANYSSDYSNGYSNSFQKENPFHKVFRSEENKVVTKTINGRTGGIIRLTHIYRKNYLNFVTVNATLIIPPGAFQGIRDITLIDDYKTASIYCYPHMTFDKALYLNLTFVGLNLTDLGFTGTVKFGYIQPDGIVDPCVNDGITLDPLHGAVGVVRARIHHFSRYSFSR